MLDAVDPGEKVVEAGRLDAPPGIPEVLRNRKHVVHLPRGVHDLYLLAGESRHRRASLRFGLFVGQRDLHHPAGLRERTEAETRIQGVRVGSTEKETAQSLQVGM